MNNPLLNVIATHPRLKGVRRTFWIGVTALAVYGGYSFDKYHDEVIEYQKNLFPEMSPEDHKEIADHKTAEFSMVEMSETELSDINHELKENKTLAIKVIDITDTDKDNFNLSDITDAIGDNATAAWNSIYGLFSESKNEIKELEPISSILPNDNIEYDNSAARLDSITKHFPIFDEFTRKYDDEYTRNVSLYTELPDNSLSVSGSREFVQKVVKLSQESDRQRDLGNQDAADRLRKEAVFETIIRFEGMRNDAYDDGRGFITICNGINLDAPGKKEFVMKTIDVNEDEYKKIYKAQRLLSTDEMRKLTVASIDETSEYDQQFVHMIKKAHGAKNSKKAKEIIRQMPTSSVAALKAIIHQTWAHVDKKELYSEYQKLSNPDASHEDKISASEKISDRYYDKMTEKSDLVGVRLQLRALASEGIMTENPDIILRPESAAKIVNQNSRALGNATKQIYTPVVGKSIFTEDINITELDLTQSFINNNKTITFAHADGKYVKFSHDSYLEVGQIKNTKKPIPKHKT